jgi:plastocyanin
MRSVILALVTTILILFSCQSTNKPSEQQVRFKEDVYMNSMRKTDDGTVHHTVSVTIEQMKFQPDTLTVNSGDTVLFVNKDIVTHDITEQSSKEWSSGPMAADGMWKFVPGKSADFYCTIHPMMKGRIIVR